MKILLKDGGLFILVLSRLGSISGPISVVHQATPIIPNSIGLILLLYLYILLLDHAHS